MLIDDFPLEAWQAVRPEQAPSDLEMFAPEVWRVGDVVLKKFPNVPLAQFRRIVRAHRQAGRLLRAHEGFDAQKLLAHDEAHRALLLDWVAGRSGRMELISGVDPARVMARAAQWLTRLHAGRDQSEGPFDAQGPLDRLPRRPDCAEEAMYLKAHAALAREAEYLQGRTTAKAVLHGDMTLANLLYNEQAVTGIDFENLAQHPVARDVGELWADLLLYVPDIPRARGILPIPWEAAFTENYGPVDAAVCAFFTRHRLLRSWAAIPASDLQRGPSGENRLMKLRRLVGNGAFGVGVLD